jgi:replication factor C subunit 2/4
MIIKYTKINKYNLYNKIKDICTKENYNYTEEGIETLLFISDNDIRQAINNLECIYYSSNILSSDNVYLLIDQPKPFYIDDILNYCLNGKLQDAIKIIINLTEKGYTPNDILLTFMKCLIENKLDNNTFNKDTILKIYEIISLSYIRVNAGIDTLLQLCGCICKIYVYLDN